MCSFTGPEDFCVWIAGHVSLKDSTEGFRHSCHCELLPGDASCQKGKEQPKGKGALLRLCCWAKLPHSAGVEGLCNAQEHFGSARRRFPGLWASARGQRCGQEPESGDQSWHFQACWENSQNRSNSSARKFSSCVSTSLEHKV